MAQDLPPPANQANPDHTHDRLCRPQEHPQTPLRCTDDQSRALLQPGRRRDADVQRHAFLHARHMLLYCLAYYLHGCLWNRRRN